VEAKLEQAQEKIFLKYLNPKDYFTTIGKSLVGEAAGIFMAGVCTIASLFEEIRNYKKINDRYWQELIISNRNLRQRFKHL
jgi:hypothetical protein